MTVCWLVVNALLGMGHASSCRSGRSPYRHVNLLHDQGRPLHGSGSHLVGSRTSLWPAEQIVCPVEIAGHDYPSNDADDALAPFVHGRSLTPRQPA